ncbi:MAG: DUF3570 domain-containing protein [Fibrobacterales bacterium]
MVVKLVIFLVLPLLIVAPLFASGSENSLDLRYHFYTDKNQVTAYTPVLALTKWLDELWSVSYEQEIDAVTGASRSLGYNRLNTVSKDETLKPSEPDSPIDALSGATKPEVRFSESFNVSRNNQGDIIGLGFYMSHEPDYTSYSPSINVALDFNERNTTISASYGRFFDTYHGREGFAPGGDKNISSFSFSFAQSLTPFTMVSLSGNYVDSWGFLGHPYRPVTLEDGDSKEERVPDAKTGIALSANIIQGYELFDEYLGSINVHYRNYHDSWGMKSHTIDTKLFQHITDELYIRLRHRFYTQGSMDFIYAQYSTDDKYRSADIRYYSFFSNLFGFKLAGGFPDSWEDIWFVPTQWNFTFNYLYRSTRNNPDLYQFFGDTWYSGIDDFMGVSNYYTQADLLLGIQYAF